MPPDSGVGEGGGSELSQISRTSSPPPDTRASARRFTRATRFAPDIASSYYLSISGTFLQELFLQELTSAGRGNSHSEFSTNFIGTPMAPARAVLATRHDSFFITPQVVLLNDLAPVFA